MKIIISPQKINEAAVYRNTVERLLPKSFVIETNDESEKI